MMSDFPTTQMFCVNVPLYAYHPVTAENFQQFLQFSQGTSPIDSYCMKCGRVSTFVQLRNAYTQGRYEFEDWADYHKYLEMRWKCTRDNSHEIVHLFMFDADRGVQKIGQYPSAHDVTIPELKKFRKILGDDKYSELAKAVGLHAHGVGAGSLIYLRRIFEGLIEEAHCEALESDDWCKIYQSGYLEMRVADKIKSLKHYLPDFLVGNTRNYSILSRGVHSTPESECLEYFPVLKVAIELILNQKLRAIEQKKNEDEINRLLQAIG